MVCNARWSEVNFGVIAFDHPQRGAGRWGLQPVLVAESGSSAMTQDEIISLLADALDDARPRLDVQEKCIEMVIDQIVDISHQMTGALEEGRTTVVTTLNSARLWPDR